MNSLNPIDKLCYFYADGNFKCAATQRRATGETFYNFKEASPQQLIFSIEEDGKHVSNSKLTLPYKSIRSKSDSFFKDICGREWGVVKIAKVEPAAT